MMKMYFKGIHSYYVAYCFRTENDIGFGSMIIRNKSKMKPQTEEDLKVLISYIKNNSDNINMKNVTIMDFRELKKE